MREVKLCLVVHKKQICPGGETIVTADGVPRSPFDLRQLRRAQPLNQPLPATWRWIAELPPQVRPLSVVDRFPRIANILARTCLDGADFAAYMDSLLQDRRGDRRGFPNDVRSELVILGNYYAYRPLVVARSRW